MLSAAAFDPLLFLVHVSPSVVDTYSMAPIDASCAGLGGPGSGRSVSEGSRSSCVTLSFVSVWDSSCDRTRLWIAWQPGLQPGLCDLPIDHRRGRRTRHWVTLSSCTSHNTNLFGQKPLLQRWHVDVEDRVSDDCEEFAELEEAWNDPEEQCPSCGGTKPGGLRLDGVSRISAWSQLPWSKARRIFAKKTRK